MSTTRSDVSKRLTELLPTMHFRPHDGVTAEFLACVSQLMAERDGLEEEVASKQGLLDCVVLVAQWLQQSWGRQIALTDMALAKGERKQEMCAWFGLTEWFVAQGYWLRRLATS